MSIVNTQYCRLIEIRTKTLTIKTIRYPLVFKVYFMLLMHMIDLQQNELALFIRIISIKLYVNHSNALLIPTLFKTMAHFSMQYMMIYPTLIQAQCSRHDDIRIS